MSVDIAQARQFLERRAAARQAALDARFAQAWTDFRVITELVIARYHPRRLWQWGSLLDRRKFTEHSDLDLAVEGITDAATFFALYGEADRLTRFSLDLIALENVEPEFAALIRLKGKAVYERPD
jgi:predicted nucleotidyltransferase